MSGVVLVTGGAGYVGSALVPRLVKEGYHVRVVDLLLYGKDVFQGLEESPDLEVIEGDIRDQALIQKALKGVEHVIHLACISNDPSFELDPNLGKEINYTAFEPLVDAAKEAGVKRFIYASSSSVYGIKEEKNVTEDLRREPLTDYSKYKALCEDILLEKASETFTPLIIRPATVCGYAPRQRLDVVVNILTSQAYVNRSMTVFGGTQLRPNIHVDDMVEVYVQSLTWDAEKIHCKIFNAGYENHSLLEIAEMVKKEVGSDVQIKTVPTEDLRSYHISSSKIQNELGFTPKHTIQDAIRGLVCALDEKRLEDPLNNEKYYNIKTMQAVGMK